MTVPGSDDPTPDSALDTGSDAGDPGIHLGVGDLSPSEERLLAALERDVERPDPEPDGLLPGADALGVDPAEVRAAEDDAPLPAEGGLPDDGLAPRFEEPGGS